MLPLILAVAGGYLIGNSAKKEVKYYSGGMIIGHYYKDKDGQEYRYLGDNERKENTGVFSDDENFFNKDYSEFDLFPKNKNLFGIF